MENLAQVKTDPSTLTTAMVLREVEIIRDSIDDKVDARRREIKALQELFESKLADTSQIRTEKFKSLDTQLELLERQRVEQKKDTKDAVDAALIAQKEAVKEQTIASGLSIAKSEAATAKQLDQLSKTLDTAISGVTQSATESKDTFNVSISDIKERLGKLENVKIGASEQKAATKDNFGLVYTIIGIVGAAIALLITLSTLGVLK